MRRGVTLLEVLFCVGIVGVAVLGAVAVFPVALSTAKKGELADLSAVGGESAIATFRVQGMHDSSRWLAWNTSTQAAAPFTPQSGVAYCIDPAFFAHNAADDPGAGNLWSFFPAAPPPSGFDWRMRRITLNRGDQSSIIMPEAQADMVFRIADQLLSERPADNALPAAQLFTEINGQPGRRQEEGRLTWFATLVPKIDRLNPTGDEYVLSIVVCRNRSSGEGLHVNDPAAPMHPWSEWTATINAGDMHSLGIGGGEVTIRTNATYPDASQFLGLKTGQWVMLSRLLPTASGGNVQHHQWYRVSDADETDGSAQDVSLIGGDWPADILPLANPDGSSDPCEVTINTNVLHVYERTLKIR